MSIPVREKASVPPAAPQHAPPAVPLGVVVIGRKRPGFDQEWNGIMLRRAQGALESLGFQCVGIDRPVADDQAMADVLGVIRRRGCHSLLVLQPSIGNGQLMMTFMQHWAEPVVLWATPERQESADVSSCSLVGQHMLASILRGANHPFEFVVGDPQDDAVVASVARALRICGAVRAVRSAKIGLIGAQPPGYIAMAADPLAARRQLGAQFAPLSLPQFLDRARAIEAPALADDLQVVAALKLPMRGGVSEADLTMQSRFYLALRATVEEERLDALAVKEWPEMSNAIGWPYLAFSRLAADGVPIGMEGDADGALTCLMGQALGAGTGFITDWLEQADDAIHFWHPGTAPLNMLDAPSLDEHFNIKKPTVVNGALRVGEPVTVARVWRCDDRYRLGAFEGRTVAPRRTVTGNAGWVEVDGGNVPALFDRLCHAGLPHHPVLFYGRHADAFRRLARMLGIDWVAN
jgi:L-fucose isomerase-like protein